MSGIAGSESGIMSAGRDSFGGVQKNHQIHNSQPSGGGGGGGTTSSMRLAFSSDGTAVYTPIISSSTYQSSGGGGSGGLGGADNSASNILKPCLNMNISGGKPMKRKRGRPRKYGPDGSIAGQLTLTAPSAPPPTGPTSNHIPVQLQPPVSVQAPPPPGLSNSSTPTSPPSPSSMKKSRGRPPGSGKKHQMEALGYL